MTAANLNDGFPEVVLPPSAEQLRPLLDFSRSLKESGADAMLVGPDGQELPVPEPIYHVLVQVVKAMGEGQAITLAPVSQKLTTQEAADFLGISRPTLIKLLEKGEIAYEKLPGSRHRRILVKDLAEYQARHKQKQEEILQFLVEDAEDLGLYDEDRA